MTTQLSPNRSPLAGAALKKLTPSSFDAWILDVAVHRDGIKLWLKQPSGEIIGAVYPYRPAFFAVLVKPAASRDKTRKGAGSSAEETAYLSQAAALEEDPAVHAAVICRRYVKAGDVTASLALQIQAKSPLQFKGLVHRITALEQFELYNTDLPLAQMFFYETGLFPFARCVVRIRPPHGKSREPLIDEIRLNDSNENIHYDLPPLRVIWLEIEASQEGLVQTHSDPVQRAILTIDPVSVPVDFAQRCPNETLTVDEHGVPQLQISRQTERETILALEAAVRAIDPDVIFTAHGDEAVFPHLLARASYCGLEKSFTLSRDNTPLGHTRFQVEGANSYMSYGQVFHRAQNQFYLNGRLHIDSAIYGGLHFDDGNIYGIAEVGRVCYVSLQRLTRVTIGGALQSLQFYHAYASGVLIPEEKKNAEHFRSSDALLLSDRGGHILQPKIGLFERVAELDFTSMYPALMVRYNVSPEMLDCPCCKDNGTQVPGLPYHLCTQRKGIVPLSLRVPLTKRIEYKKLSKQEGKDAPRFKKMEEALKWILVVCFGYLGFRNARFGRIEAHQTVCAYAREFLLNAVEIVERHGLAVIHGIVDSLYVQAPATMSTELFSRALPPSSRGNHGENLNPVGL